MSPLPRRALRRHFFRELMHNDLISPNSHTELALFQVLAVLMVPGLLFSYAAVQKYVAFRRFTPESFLATVATDRSFLITVSMMLMAFVAVLQWDALLLGRRDRAVLMPLPVPTRDVLAAKGRAVAEFLGLFAVAVNLFPAIIFPMVSGSPQAGLAGLLWGLVAHLLSVGSAAAFVCLANITTVVVLRAAFPKSPGISRALQIASLALLVNAVFLLPRLSPGIARIEDVSSPIAWLPPAWFLGLYETLAGRSRVVDHVLAWRAALALVTTSLGAAFAYVFVPDAALPRRVSTPSAGSVLRAAVQGPINRWLLRSPTERAVFWFVLSTIARSQPHRLYLGAYAAVGLSLAAPLSVFLTSRDFTSAAGEALLLRAPVILMLFLVAGLRYIFTIPAELPANWPFRLARPPIEDARAAARKAALLVVGGGISCFLPGLLYVSGSWTVLLVHTVYCTCLALVVTVAATYRFRKIPFTCSYHPGKANLRLYWAAYLIGFLLYVSLTTALESWLLRAPYRAAFCVAGAAFILGWQRRAEAHRAVKGDRPVFEDEPSRLTSPLGLGV